MQKLILTLFIGIFSFSILSAQEQMNLTSELPSEQTYQAIHASEESIPSLRSAPDDGPALGEVITPIGNSTVLNLLVIGAIYFLIRLHKNRTLRSVNF